MTSPGDQIDVDPGELWGHAVRSRNRAVDYHTDDPGINDGGWPSQRAHDDARTSAAGASQAFDDRQSDRGQAVGAAADGFTNTDVDSAKMLQGFMGAFMQALGSFSQGMAGFWQGMFQGGAQGLSAGAQSLAGTLTSGATLLSQGLPKGATLDHASVPVTPTPPGVGTGAGAGGGGPALGTTLPPADTTSRTTPGRSDRDGGRDDQLTIEPAVGIMPGGMGGLAAVPKGREAKGPPPTTYVVTTGDGPVTQPPAEPVEVPKAIPVPIDIKEA